MFMKPLAFSVLPSSSWYSLMFSSVPNSPQVPTPVIRTQVRASYSVLVRLPSCGVAQIYSFEAMLVRPSDMECLLYDELTVEEEVYRTCTGTMVSVSSSNGAVGYGGSVMWTNRPSEPKIWTPCRKCWQS